MKQPTQLSEAQVQKLFDFTESKYVKHLDVRYELVDHLATGIETSIAKDPSLSFDNALKKEYKKFPVTGFYHFVEEKQKALNKYWKRKIRSVIMSYFKLPQLLLTLAIFISAYFLYMTKPLLAIGVCFGIFVISMIYETYLMRKARSQYLFIQIFYQALAFTSAIAFSIFFYSMDSLSNYKYRYDMGIKLSDGLEQFIGLIYAFSLTIMTIILIGIITGKFKKILMDELQNKYAHLGLTA